MRGEAWCAHPAATEEAVLDVLAEDTALLADAIGGLSTLVADRVLVREGKRVAAELTLLQKGQEVRGHRCRHFAQRLPTRRERGIISIQRLLLPPHTPQHTPYPGHGAYSCILMRREARSNFKSH